MSIDDGIPTKVATKTLSSCRNCGWFRDVATGAVGDKPYIHPVYGVVTIAQAAKTDVDMHNCERHLIAKAVARRAAEKVDTKWRELVA